MNLTTKTIPDFLILLMYPLYRSKSTSGKLGAPIDCIWGKINNMQHSCGNEEKNLIFTLTLLNWTTKTIPDSLIFPCFPYIGPKLLLEY